MIFGLCNSPATFQTTIKDILCPFINNNEAIYQMAPWWLMKGQRMSFIMVWKVAGELQSQKNMMSSSKSPQFVEKAAFHSSPSFRWTLLKPQQRSRVVNHSTSHNLVSTLETNGSR